MHPKSESDNKIKYLQLHKPVEMYEKKRNRTNLRFDGTIEIGLKQVIKEILKGKPSATYDVQMVTTMDNLVHDLLCISHCATFLSLILNQKPHKLLWVHLRPARWVFIEYI